MSNTQAEPERQVTVEQILQDHGTRVYNLARRMLDNVEDAEDLTQEVLLKVFQRINKFRGESALGTWIYRITVNEALRYRERRAHRPQTFGDPFEGFLDDGRHARPVRPWREDILQAVLDNEAQQQVEQAIAELPELYRDVYLLTEVEKLPIPEVAQLLGLTVSAMKSRLHRARLLLRNKLAPYFEEAEA